MKKILTEKGMTLVEVLVAVGISAGVALVGSQLMGEFYSNQGYLEVQAEIQRQANSVKNLLNNKVACNRNFRHFPLTQNFNTPVSTNLVNSEGGIFLEPKNYGKYRLNQITISQSPDNANLKNVNLQYSWPNKKFVKNHSFEKSVSVFVAKNTDPTAIDPWSCSEVVEENRISMLQDLCNSLNDTSGGSSPVTLWDPIAQKCVLQEFKCGPNQVPTKLSSLGRFICTDIKTVLPPSSLINTGAVACGATADNISITWNGSQYQLECGGGPSCTPVNGGWSDWGPYSDWDTSLCSWSPNEERRSIRYCNNPVPSCGGATCIGSDRQIETRPCTPKFVDGTMCTYGGSLGWANCGDCQNPPVITASMCCDAMSGFFQTYTCGGGNTNSCCSTNMCQVPIPSGSAPMHYECDT